MAFSNCGGLKSFYSKYASADNRCLIVDGTLNSFAPARLTSYTIPNSVTAIGNYAFSECSGLTSIDIPESVTAIGDSAFELCYGLTSIAVENDDPANISLGFDVFFEVPVSTCVLYVPRGMSAAYKWSDIWKDFGTTQELPYAFSAANIRGNKVYYNFNSDYTAVRVTYGNIYLSVFYEGNLFVPETVEYRGVSYPVTAVGYLGSSDKLYTVHLPASVTEITEGAFRNCPKLRAIYNNYSTDDNRYVVKDGVLLGVAPFGVNDFFIPEGVTTIGKYVFQRASMRSVTMSSTVKTISEEAFELSTLSKVEIGPSVTTIGRIAFASNFCLEEIVIPSSVKEMGYGAFQYCYVLKSVKIDHPDPATLTLVGDTFEDAPLAEATLYVPRGTKTTYEQADTWGEFGNIIARNYVFTRENNEDVTMYYCYGDNAQIWVTNEYEGVSSYSGDLIIPHRVFLSAAAKRPLVGIVENAFKDCVDLTSVKIPDSITAIGDNAFSNCSGLKEVTMLNEDPANIELGTTVFDKDLVANCTLYVPVGSKSLYVKAGTWKDFSPILEIGESPYITGDANGDGKVNVSDIAIIIDYMLERNPSGFNKDAADVNADGKINVIDISGIIQILLAK